LEGDGKKDRGGVEFPRKKKLKIATKSDKKRKTTYGIRGTEVAKNQKRRDRTASYSGWPKLGPSKGEQDEKPQILHQKQIKHKSEKEVKSLLRRETEGI